MGHSAYIGKEMFRETVKDFSKAIVSNPDNYESYQYRGIAFFIMNEYDKALADFKQAIAINPSDDLVLYFLELIKKQ